MLHAADALGVAAFDVAGHDIGGGIAQHLAAPTEDSPREVADAIIGHLAGCRPRCGRARRRTGDGPP